MPGHWEEDLVIGKGGKSAPATLVERTSRFLVPLRGRDSLTVTDTIIAAVGDLPSSIKRSPAWDCGSEMALHKQVTATGLPVFFAHPHSPWERGGNENLNRIVRPRPMRPGHAGEAGAGFLFSEPLAKTGSSDRAQIYGEISLEYGPEIAHGKITCLTTGPTG